ncbi:kinase-like protein [Paxillus ammoniavirescens]|nr:kinase-like protein [Paxillus ammoniavirescens]
MHRQQSGPPPAAIGTGSLISFVRQLLQYPQSEERFRETIISAAVSAEVVAQEGPVGRNDSVTLNFSLSPNDVTQYIKGKRSYPDDTSGGFSDVYKCFFERPGGPRAAVAVKAIRLGTSDAALLRDRGKKLRGEVHIWIRLNHPNVLKLHGIADGFAPLPALVSPWVENGTLTRYLGGAGRQMPKGQRIYILVKVAEALHYIHSAPHHVVHGDLTGSNILINDHGQPLISDFGLSSILDEHNETSYFKSNRPGSIRWVAPELLETLPKPSIQSDVYSYGCVMLHTLSGKVPYGEMRDIHVTSEKIKGIRPQKPTNFIIERSQWDLIEDCLHANPGDRPPLPDIISFLERVRA